MAVWAFDGFGHGADYNPDQWLHIEGTFEEDLRLMKLSHCNLMSVGIFSWVALEPREGQYNFAWLDHVMDALHENGVSVLLATPSGARPVWMSQKYPEVLRVNPHDQRNLHGGRHNHCFTSPVYREFVRKMNTALAERYGRHPAVVGWHISNEYGGECYCPLCQEAFREFLKAKYETIEALNQAWWTGFWSKTFSDFSEIDPPFPHGERSIHGLNLEWKRFVTAQTVDFMAAEIKPLRRMTPHLPITTNMMGIYPGLDYFRFQHLIDMASHDLYPRWGEASGNAKVAVESAFLHDLTRSLLKKPFLLMESTPSVTNWHEVCKLKRPGMHLLSSMQAVAHGADTVQYFQWRKSRGSSEKFHGAVVDHVGNEHTRVFREVSEVGEWLEKLAPAAHSQTHSPAALIFDWNNRWAIEDAQGPRRDKQHDKIAMEHYEALIRQGVNIDIIDSEQSFDGYQLIVAPMLYMVKPGVAERLEKYVSGGGTLVCTYWTGIVNENDLCFLGGFPGPLRKLLGIWSEEIDTLYDGQSNHLCMEAGNAAGIDGTHECGFLLDLCHAEGAEVLATYGEDFYKGYPALTKNGFGKGNAYYIAARTGVDFLSELYKSLLSQANVKPLVEGLPVGVYATRRGDYLFVMNFTDQVVSVNLPKGVNAITEQAVNGATELAATSVLVLRG